MLQVSLLGDAAPRRRSRPRAPSARERPAVLTRRLAAAVRAAARQRLRGQQPTLLCGESYVLPEGYPFPLYGPSAALWVACGEERLYLAIRADSGIAMEADARETPATFSGWRTLDGITRALIEQSVLEQQLVKAYGERAREVPLGGYARLVQPERTLALGAFSECQRLPADQRCQQALFQGR